MAAIPKSTTLRAVPDECFQDRRVISLLFSVSASELYYRQGRVAKFLFLYHDGANATGLMR